ncbi:hypothetical protein [Aquisalimonas sp.]|uniref:DUF4870 family protein n=1 Tax=Aquisalimonas sp. TaxID=1872621 RepID=UPI0025BA728D|nr:hypothetical protein [Aquisalimonas sp.]
MGSFATAGGEDRQSSRTLPMTVYILFFMGMLTVITAPVGVLIAHAARGKAPAWLHSHYTFQIRSFWLGLPVLLVGLLLTGSLVGYLVIAGWVVWVIARCASGVNHLMDRQPVPDPKALWLGGPSGT